MSEVKPVAEQVLIQELPHFVKDALTQSGWYLVLVPDLADEDFPPHGYVKIYLLRAHRSPKTATVACRQAGNEEKTASEAKRIDIRGIAFDDGMVIEIMEVETVYGIIDEFERGALPLAKRLLRFFQDRFGFFVYVPTLKNARGEDVSADYSDWQRFHQTLDAALVDAFARFLMATNGPIRIISLNDLSTMLSIVAQTAREMFEEGFEYARTHGGTPQIAPWKAPKGGWRWREWKFQEP